MYVYDTVGMRPDRQWGASSAPAAASPAVSAPASFSQPATSYGGSYAGQTSQAWNAATQANLQRYNQILAGFDTTSANAKSAAAALQAGYQDRYNQAMQALAGYGDAEQAALNRSFANQQGALTQRMTASGLRGTTAYGTAASGLASQQALTAGQLADSIARTKLGYQSQLSQDALQAQQYGAQNLQGLDLSKYAFMNSRTDAYPDVNSMAALYQARGKARGSLGGYGGQQMNYGSGAGNYYDDGRLARFSYDDGGTDYSGYGTSPAVKSGGGMAFSRPFKQYAGTGTGSSNPNYLGSYAAQYGGTPVSYSEPDYTGVYGLDF